MALSFNGRGWVAVSLAFWCLSAPAAAPGDASEKPEVRIARLVRALSHEEFIERERATESLIVEGPRALDAVRPLLRAQDGETLYRARRVFQGIRGFDAEVEARILALSATLKKDAVPGVDREIAAIIDGGPSAVTFAVEALQGIATPQAASFRDELVVGAAFADFERGRGAAAAETLRSVGGRAVSLLGETALDVSASPERRVFALNALRQVRPLDVKAPALKLLQDPDGPVRRLALLHLAELAGPDDFRAVARAEATLPGRSFLEGRMLTGRIASRMELTELRAALRDPADAVRAAAAWALGMRADAEARAALVGRLGDKAAVVRIEAAGALAAMGNDEDLAPLGMRLGEESDVEVAAACLTALSAFGPKAVGWMSVALRHQSAAVRRRCAALLGRLETTRPLHALVMTLEDEDPAVDAAVLSSVARLGGVALPELVGIGTDSEREDATAKVRRWWRGESDKIAEKEKLLGEMAVEGGRVVHRIDTIVSANFLSMKASKDTKPRDDRQKSDELHRPPEAAPEKLMQAVREAISKELGKDASPIAADVRGPVAALLARGRFRSLADMGEFLGALPVPWDRSDYVGLMNRSAKAIVASLGDPFSRIMVSHDADGKFSKEFIPLLFGGPRTSGVMVKRSGDDVVVDFVLAGSPAFRAGLEYGDRLVMIDGKPVEKLSQEELAEALAEKATLTLFRQGWPRPFAFTLEPEFVFAQEPVRHALLPGKVGYLWLQYFGQGTDAKVEWALRELEKQGARGLVFDVRNNPGGLVIACTNMVDKFLGEKQKITTLEPRSGAGSKQEIMSTASATDRDYPVAVLINRSSASASELLSGTLQDLGRAVLVGERTYGKGIGQQGFHVSGFTGKSVFGDAQTFYLLSLTTVRYFFPSGKNPHGVGVTPDREVRPWTASGDRYLRIHGLEQSRPFTEYVEKLAGEEGTVALVRWDGGDPARYPGFDAFYAKLRNPPSRPDVRRSVRRALRQRLAATYPVLGLVDPAEDRVLRAALEELAGKLGIEDYDELLRQEAAVPMTAAAPESDPPRQEAPLEEEAEDNSEQPEDAKASEPDNSAPESEPSRQEAPLEEGAEDNSEQPEDAKASEPDNSAPESEPS